MTAAIPITHTPDLTSLITRQKLGVALERDFYTSEAIYQQDLKKYWGESWHWAGHISQIPNSGDYFLFEFGTESVIISRDESGTVHAHLNVCRHRGSRVCLERSGNARNFTCPYHAWSYNLKGELRSGRLMPEGFKREDYGLFPAQLINYQGLLFISLSDNPPALEKELSRMKPLTQPFGLEQLKIAHQASYPVPANWKLAVENYMECYHCTPSHREYARSHSLKDLDAVKAMTPDMLKRSAAVGLPTEEMTMMGKLGDHLGHTIFYRRYPLFPGFDTGSEDGKALAPLLGALKGYDGGATDLQVGMLNNFLMYSDHVVGYRFLPKSRQETEIQTVWMVRAEAKEGRDYDLDKLIWLWDITTQADEKIIRHNQEGVNSFHYQGGPLSEMEEGIVDFYADYLGLLEREQ